ncbi:hypothetical protein B0H11DRAFT_2330600 [Mycena galericulata]|nr:hypothetical protein B0H11DRAFT_2330600 [Mycena galericulata]
MTALPCCTVIFLLAALLTSCATLFSSSALDRSGFRLLLVWICRLLYVLPLLEAFADKFAAESEALYGQHGFYSLSTSPPTGFRAKMSSTKPPPIRLAEYLRTHPQHAPLAPYRYMPSCRLATCSSPTTSCLLVIIHVRPARYHSVAQALRPIFLHTSISNLPAPTTLHVPKMLSPAAPTKMISLFPQVDAGAVLQKETTPIPQTHTIHTLRTDPNLPLRASSHPLAVSGLCILQHLLHRLHILSPAHFRFRLRSLAKELLQRVTAQTDGDAYYEELARMAALRPSFGSAVCVPMEVD